MGEKWSSTDENNPVDSVTYFGALLYAESLNRDLPTEAELMRAADEGMSISDKLLWTKDWQANPTFNNWVADYPDP